MVDVARRIGKSYIAEGFAKAMKGLLIVWRFVSRVLAVLVGARAHAFMFAVYRMLYTGGFWRVRRLSKRPLMPGHHFLAVCAIMKNEASYLREWIEFHLMIGVEKFYLYANDCTDNTFEVLQPYVDKGCVDVVIFNGERMQLKAYADCLRRHSLDTEWLSFIDLDEFIVLPQGKSARDFLHGVGRQCNQVLLKWLLFGSGGQKSRVPGLVVERFVRRGDVASARGVTKSIVRPRMVYEVGAHSSLVKGLMRGTEQAAPDAIRIHHYYCKSWEEYAKRATRGDVAQGLEYARHHFTRKIFDVYDQNDVIDTSALQFLAELKRRCA